MYWVVPIGGNSCPAPDATGVPLVALVVESPILTAAEFPAVALISSQQAGVRTLLAINGWALPSPVISAILWTKTASLSREPGRRFDSWPSPECLQTEFPGSLGAV